MYDDDDDDEEQEQVDDDEVEEEVPAEDSAPVVDGNVNEQGEKDEATSEDSALAADTGVIDQTDAAENAVPSEPLSPSDLQPHTEPSQDTIDKEAEVDQSTDGSAAGNDDVFFTPATKAPVEDNEDLVDTVESMISQTATMFSMAAATSLFGPADDDEANKSNESNDGIDQEVENLETVSEEIREEVGNITLPDEDEVSAQEEVTAAEDSPDSTTDEQVPSTSSIPQDVLDKLMDQMQRMNMEHQSELENVENKHRIEMAELEERHREELNSAQKASNDPSIHDKCLANMRKLEKEFNERLDAKENDFSEVVRKNEGMRLKLDAVKRELEGTSKLLETRDKEISDLRQGHDQNVQGIDSQLQATRKEVSDRDDLIQQLKVSCRRLHFHIHF